MANESDHPSPLSRRTILRLGAATGAAAGAAAVSTLGLPTLASAAGGVQASGLTPVTSKLAVRPNALAISPNGPLGANVVGNVVDIGDWVAYNGTLTYAAAFQGQYSAGGFMAASLDVPPGASPVALAAFGTSVSGQAWTVFRQDLLAHTLTVVGSASSTSGGYQFVNIFFSPIAPLQFYQRLVIQALPSGDANNVVNGVGYFYIPANPAFHTIAPARAYDSRLHDGPIFSGQTRTVSVASTTGGAALVPPTASAVIYNLTVADTTGTGFLGLFPAGTAWPGNSSINWFTANELVANGGIVALGGDRQINVLCGGGGSTDFIVDVTGYFL
jgi:hypothetical protein